MAEVIAEHSLRATIRARVGANLGEDKLGFDRPSAANRKCKTLKDDLESLRGERGTDLAMVPAAYTPALLERLRASMLRCDSLKAYGEARQRKQRLGLDEKSGLPGVVKAYEELKEQLWQKATAVARHLHDTNMAAAKRLQEEAKTMDPSTWVFHFPETEEYVANLKKLRQFSQDVAALSRVVEAQSKVFSGEGRAGEIPGYSDLRAFLIGQKKRTDVFFDSFDGAKPYSKTLESLRHCLPEAGAEALRAPTQELISQAENARLVTLAHYYAGGMFSADLFHHANELGRLLGLLAGKVEGVGGYEFQNPFGAAVGAGGAGGP